MSEAWFYHISPEGKLTRVASPADALAAGADGGYIWLDYREPVKDDLTPLIGLLGLHPLAIEDCLDEEQVPKIEDFPNNTFIIFNAFEFAEQVLSIAEIDIFLSKNYLVTVSHIRIEGGRLPVDIERLAEKDAESLRQGPAFLLYEILDRVVDQKFTAIEALEEKLDSAEETLLADLSKFNPGDLLRIRRDLLALRKSLFHEREILVKISRQGSPFIPDKAIFHFRDIYDHLAKFFELTESSRDIVSSLMEMYLSMLNNEMARAANDTNLSVRRLTIITTIFMPLTLIAGIGGMSEYSMMTGPENWRIAYPLFILAMVVLGFLTFKLLKWIERRDSAARRAQGDVLGPRGS